MPLSEQEFRDWFNQLGDWFEVEQDVGTDREAFERTCNAKIRERWPDLDPDQQIDLVMLLAQLAKECSMMCWFRLNPADRVIELSFNDPNLGA